MNRPLPSSRPRRPRAGVVVLALLVSLAGGGCREPRPALSHTVDSPDALARTILTHLAAQDRAALERLALSRDEFEAHIWPHLPVSRPETNMPMSFVWNRLAQQSEGRLSQLLARHGGARHTFVSITFRGERSQYGDIEVSRDSVVTVRTPDGTTEDLELFGSMIAQAGRVKVFSYVTD